MLRGRLGIELIASENFTSAPVMEVRARVAAALLYAALCTASGTHLPSALAAPQAARTTHFTHAL